MHRSSVKLTSLLSFSLILLQSTWHNIYAENSRVTADPGLYFVKVDFEGGAVMVKKLTTL